MKVKVLSRNPDDYVRETKLDIQRGKFTHVSYTLRLANISWLC